MGVPSELVVSANGQTSLPAAVRRRWGLDHGGRVTVVDLDDVVVLLPTDGRQKLLRQALSAEDHLQYVRGLDGPDLVTT